MKAATLNGKQAVTSNHKLDGQSDWILLVEKLGRFFDDSYESDWEKKTGLPWQEWAKFPSLE
jgi:hypothetical protein